MMLSSFAFTVLYCILKNDAIKFCFYRFIKRVREFRQENFAKEKLEASCSIFLNFL